MLLLFLPCCKPPSTRMIFLKHRCDQLLPCLQLCNGFPIHLERKLNSLPGFIKPHIIWSLLTSLTSSENSLLFTMFQVHQLSSCSLSIPRSFPAMQGICTFWFLCLESLNSKVSILQFLLPNRVPMPKSAFALDDGTGWYRKTSGSHHWKSYYHTSLTIRLLFTHAHLLTLGPQHSFLPNS